MEFRGINYSVIRAASREGWRWSVECEYTECVGMHASREGAMLDAERFIDEVVSHRKRLARLRNQISAQAYT
jgi:hypothetical protein